MSVSTQQNLTIRGRFQSRVGNMFSLFSRNPPSTCRSLNFSLRRVTWTRFLISTSDHVVALFRNLVQLPTLVGQSSGSPALHTKSFTIASLLISPSEPHELLNIPVHAVPFRPSQPSSVAICYRSGQNVIPQLTFDTIL